MRIRSRWVLGFCSLAMTAPAASSASAQVVATPFTPPPNAAAPLASAGTMIPLEQAPDSKPAMPPGMAGMPPGMAEPLSGSPYTPGSNPGQPSAPATASTASAPMPGHNHHGLFGHRHCVECQRARAKAADGVDIPPPPGYPGAPAMVAGETVVSGPVVVGEPSAPGYAVVGGPSDAAGFAMTEGGMPSSEPAPIGVARGSMGGAPGALGDPRLAGAMARRAPGSYDPSVMPTSVPPPPAPMSGPGHNRPHIISHMIRPSMYLRRHQEREDRRREQHAAEAYGPDNQKVNDLPASMVYGRR